MNVILLVNLVWSTVLYTSFLGGRESFRAFERWQMNYLPVYARVGGNCSGHLPALVWIYMML